jgi:hypothetical protein
MKKILTTAVMAIMMSTTASAQNDNQFTLNTRAWSTNYFTTLIYAAAESLVEDFAIDDDMKAKKTFSHIIPDPDLVFPIGMGKSGFSDEGAFGDIYGPYHYAFGNPFKHIGDYAIGLDASWKTSYFGLYAGTYFKSQEVVFKETDDNIRGFYIQPRAGIILGSMKHSFEAGVFYDVVTGCGGSIDNTDKDMLKSGLGLDFALSTTDKKERSKFLLQFSMPLHNFFNTDYAGQGDLKRKVGYIMLTQRIIL